MIDSLAHTLVALICVRDTLGLCDTVEYLARRADELATKLRLDEDDKKRLIEAVERDINERRATQIQESDSAAQPDNHAG
jgi:hypothetical protein